MAPDRQQRGAPRRRRVRLPAQRNQHRAAAGYGAVTRSCCSAPSRAVGRQRPHPARQERNNEQEGCVMSVYEMESESQGFLGETGEMESQGFLGETGEMESQGFLGETGEMESQGFLGETGEMESQGFLGGLL